MGTAYGTTPRPTALPDPFGQLSKLLPNLGATNTAAANAIQSRIGGNLAPGTTNAIQDAAATWGASTGMPGFGPGSLGGNKALRNIGLTSEGQTTQGLKDYSQFVPTVSGTQTVAPALQAEISSQNNQLAAAPDPASAASHAENLFAKYQKMLNNPNNLDWSKNSYEVLPATLH